MSKLQEKIQREIGDRIYWLRKGKNLSQAKLAELADLDENTIGKIERGELNTGFYNLFKICMVLEIKVVELYQGY